MVITGQINMSDVNAELQRPYNTPINFNDSATRTMAQVASGGYGMNAFYGKCRIAGSGDNSTSNTGTFVATQNVDGGQFKNLTWTPTLISLNMNVTPTYTGNYVVTNISSGVSVILLGVQGMWTAYYRFGNAPLLIRSGYTDLYSITHN